MNVAFNDKIDFDDVDEACVCVCMCANDRRYEVQIHFKKGHIKKYLTLSICRSTLCKFISECIILSIFL